MVKLTNNLIPRLKNTPLKCEIKKKYHTLSNIITPRFLNFSPVDAIHVLFIFRSYINAFKNCSDLLLLAVLKHDFVLFSFYI
jgi:hypothetical protein